MVQVYYKDMGCNIKVVDQEARGGHVQAEPSVWCWSVTLCARVYLEVYLRTPTRTRVLMFSITERRTALC